MDRSLDEIISERPVYFKASVLQLTSSRLTSFRSAAAVMVAAAAVDLTEELLLPLGHLAETKVLATALERYANALEQPKTPRPCLRLTSLCRCRILLLLRDLSVLARTRHSSAPAHHSMPLEPCDIDQQQRTLTNEHELTPTSGLTEQT